jgi:hypothetical protein
MSIRTFRGILAFIAVTIAVPAQALDFDNFRKLAQDTIRQMDMGVVGDIDAMIAIQEELIVIGMEGGVDYLQQSPADGQPLQITIMNAERMKEMSLDEIEAQWHEGAYLAKRGIEKDKIEHFGPVMSLMDTVIHPATSYLALIEYKHTGNPEMLARAKAELEEVLIHLDQLQASGGNSVASAH